MSHDSNIPLVSPGGQQHEGTGIDSRVIMLCGLGLLGLVALSMLIAGGIRHLYSQNTPPVSATSPMESRSISATPLDPRERQSRQTYEDHQRQRLTTYDWSDRSRGKVRIPIDRAMAILVDKQRRGDQ